MIAYTFDDHTHTGDLFARLLGCDYILMFTILFCYDAATKCYEKCSQCVTNGIVPNNRTNSLTTRLVQQMGSRINLKFRVDLKMI